MTDRRVYAEAKIGLSAEEHVVFEDLRRLTGVVCDADVLRLALFHLTKHYDLHPHRSVWALRHRRDPRKAIA